MRDSPNIQGKQDQITWKHIYLSNPGPAFGSASPPPCLSLPSPSCQWMLYIIGQQDRFSSLPLLPSPSISQGKSPFSPPDQIFSLFFREKGEEERESPLCRCVGLAKKGEAATARAFFSFSLPWGLLAVKLSNLLPRKERKGKRGRGRVRG